MVKQKSSNRDASYLRYASMREALLNREQDVSLDAFTVEAKRQIRAAMDNARTRAKQKLTADDKP